MINPKIVRGMTMGGIAHGIGAALYEEFAYNEDGQLMAQSFMDYLLPSAHEVPPVEIVHHETPSPHTVFGQKGSGESGYLGAPAAIASAVNDAVRPLGIAVNSLPIKMAQLGDMIAAARENVTVWAQDDGGNLSIIMLAISPLSCSRRGASSSVDA